MQFDPVHFQNKLGQTVLVRSALEEDAAALLQYLRETTAETPFLLREPEEVTMTLEQEKAFIHQTLAAPPLPDAGRLLRWKTGRDLFLCSRRPFPAVCSSL